MTKYQQRMAPYGGVGREHSRLPGHHKMTGGLSTVDRGGIEREPHREETAEVYIITGSSYARQSDQTKEAPVRLLIGRVTAAYGGSDCIERAVVLVDGGFDVGLLAAAGEHAKGVRFGHFQGIQARTYRGG
ncbi:hypothetical protein CSOJ01_07229 [Colletotrichum sojae]|uniref:Uncharacterized protein n=1 Tax=Colletotrichum sojae TaxID=2175907 RepID=A0A8H6J9B5_9PEZI|nr:hypothetical protein CSOJ01_07229 [Colletotrichum sojae]